MRHILAGGMNSSSSGWRTLWTRARFPSAPGAPLQKPRGCCVSSDKLREETESPCLSAADHSAAGFYDREGWLSTHGQQCRLLSGSGKTYVYKQRPVSSMLVTGVLLPQLSNYLASSRPFCYLTRAPFLPFSGSNIFLPITFTTD